MSLPKFTLIENFFLSFKKGDGGYSARKLSAFAGVLLGAYMIFRDKIPEAYRINAFYALLLFALLCLGLVTIPQLIEVLKFKNGKDANDEIK